MPPDRQVGFWGGELTPDLWGRTDHPRYAGGARTLLNFLVTQHGIARNRAGTRHVMSLSHKARLMPFIVDPSDAMVMVFTNGSVGFVSNEGFEDHGGAVSVGFQFHGGTNTPYDDDGLPTLRHAQAGEVFTVVSSLYAPREITRTALGFASAELSFDIPETPAWLDTPVAVHRPATRAFGGDDAHPALEWTWAVTRILRDVDGNLYETKKVLITQYVNEDGSFHDIPDDIAVYGDWKQKLDMGAEIAIPGGDSLVASRIFRGRDGDFGWVGETTSRYFYDDGRTPDPHDQPATGENPFKVYNGETLLRTEHPSVISFYENRMVLGATTERPSTIWESAILDYRNFDRIRPPDDDDSLLFRLNSNSNQVVRNLVPRDSLIVLTSSSEWVAGGGGEGRPMSPTAIATREFDANGCADIQAVAARGAVFFVQANGSRLLAVVQDGQGTRVLDLSTPSSHLFEGYSIVEMAYAKDPHSILWVVRNDGVLLSMTYAPDARDEDKARWTRHEIAGDGLVESVTTIPEGAEDGVYLVVNRDGERSLERLANRIITDIRDAVFMDASVTYNGKNRTAAYAATISDPGGGGAVGATVTLTFASELVVGGAVDQVIQFDDPDGGLPLRLLVVTHNGASVYDVEVLTKTVPDSLWDEETVGWYLCTPTMTGLNHLEGQEVIALVDGFVVRGKTVAGGSISLCAVEDYPSYAAIVHAGLSYNSDFESLALARERGKQKNVTHATLELQYSRGGYVGAELGDDMGEILDRRTGDGFDVLAPRYVNEKMTVPGEWKVEGYIAFRQSDPLPVSIIGITRDVEYGG